MAGPDLDEAKNDIYAHPWYRVGRGSVRGPRSLGSHSLLPTKNLTVM
jgi:hypothetical protein